MERTQSLFRVSTLLLAGVVALGGIALAQKPQDAGQDKAAGVDQAADSQDAITIETIPAQRVLYRTIRGGYDKHPEVFADIKSTIATYHPHNPVNGGGRLPKSLKVTDTTSADCTGLYTSDPDSTSKATLEWGAAVNVPDDFPSTPPAARALSVPASDYALVTLPQIEAAVMFTNVGRAPVDGLKFFSWMADNGYVQAGPTRMLYYADASVDLFNATPEQMKATKAKIMVPIRKRDRGIALKDEKSQ